ncbi:MAG: cytochrome c3 family protein [Acidobacteriota bacterium]
MIRNGSPQQRLSRIVCCLWLCLASRAGIGIETPVTAQSDDKCIACHSRQKDKAGQIVSIYRSSTHSKMNVGCEACHGGDPSQMEKLKAHAGRFIARPDTSATLEMCGNCHRRPLQFFKTSRHFAVRLNVRRLDCVECHGVHGIGAASESFRWPQFCAGCHGLEYLPQLPRPFQEMLALADDLGDGLHRLEAKGRPPGADAIQRRKEIRRMISELVHQTDAKGGMDRIPRILELGATLKQRIAAEEKQ